MRILYLGVLDAGSTSAHRARALERLGHVVEAVDMYDLLGFGRMGRISKAVHYRSGCILLQRKARRAVERLIRKQDHFDIAWINSGEFLGPGAMRALRQLTNRICLYNNDDPTGRRDGNKWLSLRRALAGYDYSAVLRDVNVTEFLARGGRNIIRVWMSYDEVVHRPLEAGEQIPGYESKVAFIGTWMPERGPFMLELVRAGIPLSIWGDRWHKAPEWPQLRASWRGGAIYNRDYVKAVTGTKICLGLLSKGNRDLHTRRSVEVPYIGGLFCAERTPEHLAMYREGEEAVFWNDAKECAKICRELLDDENRRETIRKAGMRRVRELRLGNENVCQEILDFMAGMETTPRPWHPANEINASGAR